MFLTSSTHTGNLKGLTASGLTGADAICQDLANAASLPGEVKAWLSDSTGSPATGRFTQPSVPYKLTDSDGTVIANDWADLTSCFTGPSYDCLQNSIDVFENGILRSTGTGGVWTNTDTDGTAIAGLAGGDGNCDDWTVGDNNSLGNKGGSAATTEIWTKYNGIGQELACGTFRRLYCFQQ